ncbi:MAG: hypothetical protein ACKOWF_07980 [Chloroflexota bacterium]
MGAFCSPAGWVCGNLIPVQTCTSQTDTCAGTNFYLFGEGMACAVSATGYPVAITSQIIANSCTSDQDCAADTICLNVPAGSQCEVNGPNASTCVSGNVVCSQASDCPARSSFPTRNCVNNLCVYTA